MHSHIKILQRVVSKKRTGKELSFSMPHVFKAINILYNEKYVSRATLCRELHLGEGSIKTLIKHLKELEIISIIKSGTFLTTKGRNIAEKFQESIPSCHLLKDCKLTGFRYTNAVLLRDFSNHLGNGLEQRDFAILYGAKEVFTFVFKKENFVFPKENIDGFSNDRKTKDIMIEKLNPQKNDVVIITSSNDKFEAELSGINSALCTIASHDKH
tara:strand:+ start:1045 stop:1683 length:639 start_codon:yes stop_codon:yes gene_type:complete